MAFRPAVLALVLPSAAVAASIEDEGASCPATALPDQGSLPSISRLPDPFTRLNGTRITAAADWTCRRAEIKKLAERFEYGEKPVQPQTVTGTVTGTGISVSVHHNGRSSSFSARVELPSGTGPLMAWA